MIGVLRGENWHNDCITVRTGAGLHDDAACGGEVARPGASADSAPSSPAIQAAVDRAPLTDMADFLNGPH